MSKPAKNEAALLKRAGEAIRKALIKPPGCTESTGCTVGPCHCAHLAAEAAFAAIRAAGWAVVPARLTKDMEYDALRAENARLREALEDLLDDSEVHDFGEWFEDRLKQACAALDPDGQKERRAKALSELAEMDADLLDIDPEVKP